MKILLVDDEPLARDRLRRLLQRLRPEAEVIEAGSGEDALALLAREDPSLVLLDVRMPGMDGIEVAAALDRLPAPPAVIFCTAYDEYALDALRHQAVAYLLKPVRETELARALATAGRVNRVQLAALSDGEPAGRTQVSSQGHRGLETLPIAEVRCFIAGQKYVTAVAPERELLIQDALKDLEQEFATDFLRVHRNALVARRYIRRLRRDAGGSWSVELDGVALRPQVSRRHLADVKARLQQG
ncbi:MAG: DNA-binding response regulator [Haliea sp.]|uniref:LytR/AlgR family response regulator transcription factor n=1 Tax=Haliea sp. TaxID=1932666 RepID=UPI000C368BB0|nr:LytTR family DNA-binding domain-containing protein [Haliea sp.]MBM69589.1 DNA-binding response regulator [Haliea sp.]|tara:strand:+ start:27525 stop:28253 length:729 start_codon:yes stop_codon:yes gene_type:complete